MEIATKQIIRQLEDSVSIIVNFSDAEPERIKLIEQDGDCWIKPLFCNPHRITKNLFDELVSKFTGIKKFNTDPETIDSGITYDDFMDRYYNK